MENGRVRLSRARLETSISYVGMRARMGRRGTLIERFDDISTRCIIPRNGAFCLENRISARFRC